MELSLCMIVKNEEDCLARVLDCAVKFVDEIIIVDTGSTDKTRDIASKYTNKIFHFSWCDDFSKARNFSFSKATKDFIIWLDADDYITDENIKKLQNLKLDLQKYDCIMCKYATSFNENNEPIFQFFRERIVRNSRHFLWNGFIHETITPSGVIKYVDVIIQHRKVHTNDVQRNLKIYRKHKKLGVRFTAREQYYYAKELYYNGYFTKCMLEMKKFLKMNERFLPNTQDAYLTIMRCLIKEFRYIKAIKIANDCTLNCCLTAEICCELAFCYKNLNNLDSAINFYKLALQIDENLTKGGFCDRNYHYLLPFIELCVLYYKCGATDMAFQYHKKAKEYAPQNKWVILNEKFFTELDK